MKISLKETSNEILQEYSRLKGYGAVVHVRFTTHDSKLTTTNLFKKNMTQEYQLQPSSPGFVAPFFAPPSQKKKAISTKPIAQPMNAKIPSSNARYSSPMSETSFQRNDTRKTNKTETQTMPKRNNSYAAIGSDLKKKRREPESQSIQNLFANNNGSKSVTRINYGVNKTLYSNPFTYGGFTDNKQNNTLAVNVVNFDPTGITNSAADKNFSNIFDKFINKLQTDTNASITASFTKANLSIYLDKMTELLDLYYEIKTLQCWDPETASLNQSMFYIKQLLNTADLDIAISQLEDFLKGIWMPNEMIKFMIWKNQTYRTGNLENSNIFRFASPTLTFALSDPPTTSAYLIAKIANLRASVSDTATQSGTITTKVRTDINAALLKSFMDIGQFMVRLSLPLNTSTCDIDFLDIFRNQRVLYGSTATPLSWPVYGAMRTVCSSLESGQISNLMLALTAGLNGGNNGTGLNTGLLEEIPFVIGSIRTNKLISDYNSSTNTFTFTNRNDCRSNITNDYHNVNVPANNTVSTVIPSGSIDLMIESQYNLDIATRMVQNQMFGL